VFRDTPSSLDLLLLYRVTIFLAVLPNRPPTVNATGAFSVLPLRAAQSA